MTRRTRSLSMLTLAFGTQVGVARAHALSTDLGDYYGGLLHPVTAPEHLLPLLALGLLAGQQSPRLARRGSLFLLAGLALGLLLSLVQPDWLFPNRLNEFSILLVGGLVALAVAVPAPWITLLLAVAGLTHGYANGTALVEGVSTGLFLLGVVSAGLLLFTLAAGASLALKQDWQPIAVRVVGSWIAATGLLLVALRL